MVRRIVVVGLATVCALAVAAAPAAAQGRQDGTSLSDDQPSVAGQLGWGLAAVGTNLGYMPAKMIYALGGGLVGLLAWGVTAGNGDVAKGILNPSFGGTWAVTPEMLQGREPILFSGPSYEPRG